MRETNGCFGSYNSSKRLVSSRLDELYELKLSFVSRIKFIRSKLSIFSDHVSGVTTESRGPRRGRPCIVEPSRARASRRDERRHSMREGGRHAAPASVTL